MRVALAQSETTNEDEINLLDLLGQVMFEHGYEVELRDGFLWHEPTGFSILPQFANLELTDEGTARTSTTIQVNHARLLPTGAFEYQHAAGASLLEAVTQGLSGWVQGDFVALCDALAAETENCQTLVLDLPEKPGEAPRKRRAVLGPVWHYAANALGASDASEIEDEHGDGGCPCCLLTNSFDAFRELLNGDGTYCVRLYAARASDGASADCRVNGEDFSDGASALVRYVESWAGAGIAFRKQYVVIHSVTRHDA